MDISTIALAASTIAGAVIGGIGGALVANRAVRNSTNESIAAAQKVRLAVEHREHQLALQSLAFEFQTNIKLAQIEGEEVVLLTTAYEAAQPHLFTTTQDLITAVHEAFATVSLWNSYVVMHSAWRSTPKPSPVHTDAISFIHAPSLPHYLTDDIDNTLNVAIQAISSYLDVTPTQPTT